MKTEKWHFTFLPAGYGRYKVIYESPATGKTWKYTTDNMELIDATKGTDNPKRKDLDLLKWFVKTYGTEVK